MSLDDNEPLAKDDDFDDDDDVEQAQREHSRSRVVRHIVDGDDNAKRFRTSLATGIIILFVLLALLAILSVVAVSIPPTGDVQTALIMAGGYALLFIFFAAFVPSHYELRRDSVRILFCWGAWRWRFDFDKIRAFSQRRDAGCCGGAEQAVSCHCARLQEPSRFVSPRRPQLSDQPAPGR
jgi:hypothetical protein